jgi:hypothetical protein
MSGSGSSGGLGADAPEPFRLTRLDVSSLVLAFVLSSVLAATWLVPALRGVDDGVRHWLALATASSLGQMLIRWIWRRVSPLVKKAARKWLEIDQEKKDAASAKSGAVSQPGDVPPDGAKGGQDVTVADVATEANASNG